ncbi:MAG: DUF2723 domain-containing protein [Chloroflexi bacterium]|nr:DUF2723 domain-containing protein [Chloroflexota bacterium]
MEKRKITVYQRLSASKFTTLSLLLIPVLYILTLAQSPVLGDPSEYTFVANMLGIAHPPGYAFITLLGKLFQTIVPIGTIAWRMHLLAAVSASLGAWFVFGIIRTVARDLTGFENLSGLAALFGAFVVATAVNHWQHAIHANPHILTATFMAANLYFLTRWWAVGAGEWGNEFTRSDKWLYAFCLSAGLGVTHHPLTVFGFPAYAIFIIWARPSLLKEWRTLLKMVGFALLGLSVWLYFVIRSPMDPGFGPTTMNTLNGFLDHVLARGLSDSLPYFSLIDQFDRARVFCSLLRLQYSLPTVGLALFGLIYPFFAKNKVCQLLTLYALTFLFTYAFVISLRAQDIMAYLVGPLLVIGLFAGLGLLWLLQIGARINADKRRFPLTMNSKGREENENKSFAVKNTAVTLTLLLAFIFGPIWQLAQNAPHVSLRNYSEGQAVIDAVNNWETIQEPNAVLLSDWERMTPLWYEQFVHENWPQTAVVTPTLVAAGTENPWLTAIFDNLPAGPVYLTNYRPAAIAGTEFRLRPSDIFYQVVEPGDSSLPSTIMPATAVANEVEIVGFDLPETAVTAGDFVPLTLAMRSPVTTDDYYVPVLYVGEMRYEFTTDSHLITPNWWAEEVIVERFDFALPHDLVAGSYPLRLNIKNLSQNEEFPLDLPLGELDIAAQSNPVATDHLLANFRQRVGLLGANVRINGRRAAAPWTPEDRLTAQPSDTINLTLEWESLAKAEESYTIFVHLIDGNNVPYVFLDYTPLGGSAPTHLWIPKWLPGQQFIDPYRLTIPPDLPPGTYFIEVGLYEMVSGRRLHISDCADNLNGDRYILGAIEVIR